MHITFILFYIINMEEYGLNVGLFRHDYWKYALFSASIKFYHCYKILQCYVIFCKYIILVEQMQREDKVSFGLLMIRIDQILIKVHNLLWKHYLKCVTHSKFLINIDFDWVFAPFDTLFIHLTQHLKIHGTWWPSIVVSLVYKMSFLIPRDSQNMGMMRHLDHLKLAESSITEDQILFSWISQPTHTIEEKRPNDLEAKSLIDLLLG